MTDLRRNADDRPVRKEQQMSHPLHHTLAKDRIESILRRAEMDRVARQGRRRGPRRPQVTVPDQEH